ncbi:MAG: hypothetical protein RIT45_2064 [Pseudomonadota bacterium]
MRLSRRALRTVVLSLALALPFSAFALPATTQVEGVLLSAGGAPAADGSYDVTFSLYAGKDAQAAAWTEGPLKVAVAGGRFQVVLGQVKPITPEALTAANLWLGVQVASDPELPRQPLHATPYAIAAHVAAGVACDGCIGGNQLGNGAVAAAKIGFNYAGSNTKGGPALDLACTGCVSVAELKFDADVDLGGNSLKAGGATFTGDVAAKTVTATSFVGDGSKLTGIKTPAGTCSKAGEVVKGIKADGTLECVAAMDPAALPKDGVDEISNGLLFNQFQDVIAADAKNVAIPDNTGAEAVSNLTFPDIGVAQKLTVTVKVSNTDLSTVALVLLPPDDKKTGLVLCDPCGQKDAKSLEVTYPVPTATKTGDLTAWVGKNPKGLWNLKAKDTSYCIKQAPGNGTLCDIDGKSDGFILEWNMAIQTLSTKKVGVGGNLVLATETAPCDKFSVGAIRYSSHLAAIQVCDGKAWFPEVLGLDKATPGKTCKAIKDRAPGIKSGTYWIDPDGEGGKDAYQAYCDQETGGGGWTLVVKVKGNDKTMNRINTAQWRNKTPITGQDCTTTKDENALCPGYDTVPFSDVMIRSLAKPQRNLAWGHRDSYASMWTIVNAGSRIMTRNRLFGSVNNLDYNGDPRYHRDCSILNYGFFTADWSQKHNGIAGHSIQDGHAGGVVGASAFDWDAWDGNVWYGYQNYQKTRCVTDFSVGGGYGNANVTHNDSYAINAHWWGNGNEYTWNWNSHGVFVR